jgi:opacity protein-like surface antigen
VPGGYLYNPDDTCNPHGNSELSRQDLLLNGYIDLGTWGGVTPYVGAGAGVALTQSDTSVNWYESNGSNGTLYNANLTPPTGGTVPPVWVNSSGTAISPQPPVSFTQQNWSTIVKSTTYHFAWALMGGFAIDITDHLKLDLGYRYVNFGTLTGTTASGQAVKENQSTQEIRAGFRYMID